MSRREEIEKWTHFLQQLLTQMNPLSLTTGMIMSWVTLGMNRITLSILKHQHNLVMVMINLLRLPQGMKGAISNHISSLLSLGVVTKHTSLGVATSSRINNHLSLEVGINNLIRSMEVDINNLVVIISNLV